MCDLGSGVSGSWHYDVVVLACVRGVLGAVGSHAWSRVSPNVPHHRVEAGHLGRPMVVLVLHMRCGPVVVRDQLLP